MIIEAAHGTGCEYKDIIQRDIFDPLKLKHSTFLLDDSTRPFAVCLNDTSNWTIDTDVKIFNPSPCSRPKANGSMGGAYSSVNDMTALFHDLFLSNKSKLISSTAARHWLRGLFTNEDFSSEIGMPWEITLYSLPSGRFAKSYGKAGDISFYHPIGNINPTLGFSVLLSLDPNNVDCGVHGWKCRGKGYDCRKRLRLLCPGLRIRDP
jgi:CubicO group peptidase (beta-lactamase class C family)